MPNNNTQHIPAEIVQQAAEQTSDPVAVVTAALEKLSSDPGAMYEGEVILSLKAIRRNDEAAYARLTAKARGCKSRLDELTKPERESRQDNLQDLIVNIARSACTFGHDADGNGIAVIETGEHREVWPLDSQGFARWLRAAYYQAHRSGIPDQALTTSIATLNAFACHEGSEMAVHIRCAKIEDVYFIDLCNEKWQAIRVDHQGWTIVERPPIYFVRTNSMRPLVTPGENRDLDLLWNHINIPETRRLPLLAWLLDSLRPETPFPILELHGEQGSAKSSTQRHLRDLIDPNKVPLRGSPKVTQDIYIAATNSYVVSFENLSYLSSEQQDALCTLATGGGFATRQFYSNGDEFAKEAKRPVIINGINHVATRPDLIERVISIETPTIPPDARKDERTLDAAWQADYPAIFAGLLDLFSASLARLPEVDLEYKYRMADYQLLGEAISQVLENPPGHFTELYRNAVTEGIDRGLEAYGIAHALQVFLNANGKTWEGTFLALLGELNRILGSDRSNWPKSPHRLAGQLKRIAPGLRQLGIEIEPLGHSRTGSRIRITSSREEE